MGWVRRFLLSKLQQLSIYFAVLMELGTIAQAPRENRQCSDYRHVSEPTVSWRAIGADEFDV